MKDLMTPRKRARESSLDDRKIVAESEEKSEMKHFENFYKVNTSR